jgi:hypothetical protein
MKKLILAIAFMLVAAISKADDTSTIQGALNSGNVTLTSGHGIYTVTSLTLNHSLNMNGNKIACSSSTGSCLVFPSGTPKKKLSNGDVYGLSDVYNSSGSTGINMQSDSDTIANVRVHKFTLYGLNASNVNDAIVKNSSFYDTGYVTAWFSNSTIGNSKGPEMVADTFDRSMQSGVSMQQDAMNIRGATGDTMKNSFVYKCIFRMPYRPGNTANECSEIRICANTTVSYNQCSGGTIGFSIVGNAYGMMLNQNTFVNQSNEAIEFASTQSGVIENNSISNQVGVGILFDSNASGNQVIQNNIRGFTTQGILFETGSNNNYITATTIQGAGTAIYCNKTNGLFICSCYFIGSSPAANAIFLDHSSGNIKILGGTITGYSQQAIKVYNVGSPTTATDNLYMNGVSMISMTSGLGSALSGSSSVGGHVMVN